MHERGRAKCALLLLFPKVLPASPVDSRVAALRPHLKDISLFFVPWDVLSFGMSRDEVLIYSRQIGKLIFVESWESSMKRAKEYEKEVRIDQKIKDNFSAHDHYYIYLLLPQVMRSW